MGEIEKFTEIENQLIQTEKILDEKNLILEKLSNSKLKLFIFLTLLGPVFQYIPLRKGSLIDNYGFPNGLIYYYIGCVVIIPVVYVLTIEKMYREIDQIEKDLESLKKRKAILEK